MTDVTDIILALGALLAAVLTGHLLPLIRGRLTAQQQELLSAAAKTAVFAAEQLFGSGKGEKKLDFVCRSLEKRGFTADRELIEAAVREYFGKEVNG